jgi:hypothetical protein
LGELLVKKKSAVIRLVVFSLTEKQTVNNQELELVKNELLKIIDKDQEIMEKPENLVVKF